MSHFSRLFLAALVLGVSVSTVNAGTVPTDDDDNTYDVDFYNQAGDSGTVYLDGNAVCSLAMKAYCSQTLAKTSGRHTAVFQATAGYKVSESFDADTCGKYPGASVNFDIYDDRVEISCNGLAF